MEGSSAIGPNEWGSGDDNQDQHIQSILRIVSMTGVGTSLIVLPITFVSYLSVKRLRKLDHGQLIAHLCLALLGVNFMLVFQEVNKPLRLTALCLVTDIILLYFTAVVLLLMAAEAIHMCYELILVPRRIKHFVLKSTFVAWVVPVLMVAFSYVIQDKHYAHDQCSSSSISDYVGFHLLAIMIQLFTWALFIIISVTVVYQTLKAMVFHRTRLSSTKQLWRTFITVSTLSAVLGLAWGFYFVGAYLTHVFNWGERIERIAIVLVSYQGLGIFVLQCLVVSEIIQLWKGWICCRYFSDPVEMRNVLLSSSSSSSVVLHLDADDPINGHKKPLISQHVDTSLAFDIMADP